MIPACGYREPWMSSRTMEGNLLVFTAWHCGRASPGVEGNVEAIFVEWHCLLGTLLLSRG